MKNKNIAVIGLGFVGLSLVAVLSSKGYKVIGIDKNKNKCNSIINKKIPFYEKDLDVYIKRGFKNGLRIQSNFFEIEKCDIIFICVGTPQKNNGDIDLSMIKDVSREIGKCIKITRKKPTIFIKSTVIPGTAQKIIKPIVSKISGKKPGVDYDIFSNPEFLQETTAIRDTENPHMVVIGYQNKKFLKIAYNFLKKIHPNTSIIITNHQTSEMIKYANNSFLATKISFINQLSNICQKIPGSNIDDIANAIGLDPRIGNLFLNAGPGYGGSCLPKDINAIINLSKNLGVEPTLFNAVEKTNQFQIKNIMDIIERNCGNLKNKKISILGLAFKPETDDIRDSISIKIIKKLLITNATIYVHDPKALDNTKEIFGKKINYSKSVKECLEDSNCCLILTGWKEYSKIKDNHIRIMNKRIIIDTRRILSISKSKCEYIGLGIGN